MNGDGDDDHGIARGLRAEAEDLRVDAELRELMGHRPARGLAERLRSSAAATPVSSSPRRAPRFAAAIVLGGALVVAAVATAARSERARDRAAALAPAASGAQEPEPPRPVPPSPASQDPSGARTAPAAPVAGPAQVAGTVIVPEGAPAGRVRVSLWYCDYRRHAAMLVRDTRADAAGAFVLGAVDRVARDDLGFRYYLLVAQLGDAAIGLAELRDGDWSKLRVEIGAPVAISGRVRDEGGKPIAGVQVHAVYFRLGAQRLAGLPEPMPPWKTTTAPDGSYHLGSMPPGAIALVLFRHPDYAQGRLDVDVADDRADVQLKPGAKIRGRVVFADGRPAARVRVECQGLTRSGWGETTTDDDGRYALTSLGPEPYNVWAVAEGATVQALANVPTEAGEVATVADLVLIDGGFVQVRIVDARTGLAFAPRDGAIGVYGPSRPRMGAAIESARLRPDGTARLRLAPGENYVYFCEEMTDCEFVGDASQTVAVRAGETTEVVFCVRPKGGR